MPDEPESADIEVIEDEDGRDDSAEISADSEKSYYYDDAHGYENFDPDSDVDESEDD